MEAFLKTLRCLLTIGLPLVIFIFIVVMVVNQDTDKFDGYVYHKISNFISPGLTELVKLITFFGSSEFLISIAGILLIFLFANEKYSFNSSMIIINLIISAILNEGLKHIIQRSRPDILRLIDIHGYSFPSGHSMVSMSFYGLLIFLCFRRNFLIFYCSTKDSRNIWCYPICWFNYFIVIYSDFNIDVWK